MTTEELAVKVAEVGAQSKAIAERMDGIANQVAAIGRLATSVEVLANESAHQTEAIRDLKGVVGGLDKKVETLEQKPAKKWDGMIEKVLWTLVAAVIGFTLAHIGIA